MRELAATLHFHELPDQSHVMEIGKFKVNAQLIIHPNPTIGYRIHCGNAVVTYLPDHEPALGSRDFPRSGSTMKNWWIGSVKWIVGYLRNKEENWRIGGKW